MKQKNKRYFSTLLVLFVLVSVLASAMLSAGAEEAPEARITNALYDFYFVAGSSDLVETTEHAMEKDTLSSGVVTVVTYALPTRYGRGVTTLWADKRSYRPGVDESPCPTVLVTGPDNANIHNGATRYFAFYSDYNETGMCFYMYGRPENYPDGSYFHDGSWNVG